MAGRDALAGLRVLLFDVDGVFTDNGLYVGEDGGLMKRFDVRDGGGVKLAQLSGLAVGLISGHRSPATQRRAAELGIEICHVGVLDKVPVFEQILAGQGVAADEVLYMGDDVMDMPLLRAAGFAVTVPEAPGLVRDLCDHVTEAPGGRGAVRETIELVLKAQGRLDRLLEKWK